jgi:hypothetical protein
MTYKLVHGIVLDRPRRVIHVVRVVDEILDFAEIDDIAEKMRNHALSRHGEQAANVVIVQGSGQETLRLFGDSRAITLVRAALFNAAVSCGRLSHSTAAAISSRVGRFSTRFLLRRISPQLALPGPKPS